MNIIQILTFKGCQTTLDFIQKMNVMIQTENLDVEIETILVSSLEKAEAMGLYGSPTLIINGVEYQATLCKTWFLLTVISNDGWNPSLPPCGRS